MVENWLESRFEISYANSGDVRIDCPFCLGRTGRPDAKAHMYVSVQKPVAHCFRCEWVGHHVGLIMSVDGCSYTQALEQLAVKAQVRDFDSIYSPRGLVNARQYIKYPVGFLPLGGDPYSLESAAVYAYLRMRLRHIRVRLEDIPRWRFGYVPGTNRLWILVDEDYWQGRAIVNGEPKYLNPPWPIGQSLWNGSALSSSTIRNIVICEGVFSAMAVGSHAVAVLGKRITDSQARRIVAARKFSITVMLDADAGEEAVEVCKRLTFCGFEGRLKIHSLKRGDPCDGLKGITENYDWSIPVRL